MVAAMEQALASIDMVIIGAYLLGVLAIGTFFAKYVSSSSDFFLAGRALPFWAIGMSIVATDIGATAIVAGGGAAYKYGLAQANLAWIGSIPAVLVAAFLFVPYYWRAGVYTIPEFLGKRFNFGVQAIQAVFWLGVLAAMLAVTLWMPAVFLQSTLGWNVHVSIWLTVAMVGIYTVSGGLAAVVMTDVLQMVIIFIGTAAILVLSLIELGGWSGMREAVLAMEHTQNHFTLLLPHDTLTPLPWTGIVFGLGIVLATAYFVGHQAIVQRVLGARSEWDSKAGMLVAGLLQMFIPLLVYIPGLAAVALYPGLEEADAAIPTLVAELLPAGLRGLMFAAFIAALMASVDSYLNSCSTVFVSDVYSKLYRSLAGRTMTDRHGMILGRSLTAVLIVAAGLTAPMVAQFETIFDAVLTILSLIQGPTLALLLLGIMWRRTTQWGALAGLVLGVCNTGILTWIGDDVFPSENPYLFVSLWSFVFTVSVTVVVSLLTPPDPMEKIRGLVWGQVMQDETVQEALENRVNGS